MRQFRGDWRDLFHGFMIALDLRKMMFGFMGILFTVVLLGLLTFGWCIVGGVNDVNAIETSVTGDAQVRLPEHLTPHHIYRWFHDRWFGFDDTMYPKRIDGIFSRPPLVWVSYLIVAFIVFTMIWSYFGGAIARSAACEIAREGERIESSKAVKYAGQRFWSFFGAPLICILGFVFFYLVTFLAGLAFRVLDFGFIGAPLAALLLPLAILAGFVMALIAVGTLCGFPLFLPAVAAEGTDAFDAFSRGFSYIYSRPWHYLWYQFVTFGYGYLCVAFVIIFAVLMTHLGLCAGAAGFELAGVWEQKDGGFDKVSQWAWSFVLSKDHKGGILQYEWTPQGILRSPHPYGRIMTICNRITKPDFSAETPKGLGHTLAGVVVLAWLIVVMGLAYGFAVSYFISQQTMIYFLLRKKVDEIEMKEIYFEEETEKLEPAPAAPSAPSGEAKPTAEAPPPAKPEEKKES